jgi:glyoxalase family protein
VPAGSLDFWAERFKQYHIKQENVKLRFGEQYVSFQDPDGLKFDLIVPDSEDNRIGWETSEVKTDVATKGFHSITLTVKNLIPTASVLTEILGYQLQKEEGNRYRFFTDAIGNASIVDIIEARDLPPGRGAAGTNHHVAFRVKDEDILMEFREKIAGKGLGITPKIDRDYFYSVYFREPGGVLFELATDNPGFTRDEPLNELGSSLKLPKQYESKRKQIEQVLPALYDQS